ncbi:methyl-accepting chemotaxis protein [bacterium]|nr:MAG: methyl-accepting chemotaxis protein [bacterium]
MFSIVRRKLLIEKEFQIKFILKVLAVIVVGTALTGIFLYKFGNYQFDRTYYLAHQDVRESWEVFWEAVLGASLASMALVTAPIIFFTLYESHRIVGPLYRVRVNLDKISGGDLTLETKLRKDDEFLVFNDVMNNLTHSLRDKVAGIREAKEALGKELEEGETDRARLRERLNALDEKISAFRI